MGHDQIALNVRAGGRGGGQSLGNGELREVVRPRPLTLARSDVEVPDPSVRRSEVPPVLDPIRLRVNQPLPLR